VLFDKIASVFFIWKNIYLGYILALEMASPGNQHCASCIGTLSFPVKQALCLVKAGSIHKLCEPHGERGAPAVRGSGGRASEVLGHSPWSGGYGTKPPSSEAENSLAAGCKSALFGYFQSIQ